jgi:hypothetical protein
VPRIIVHISEIVEFIVHIHEIAEKTPQCLKMTMCAVIAL